MGARKSPISETLEGQVKALENIFVANIRSKGFNNPGDMKFFNCRTDFLSNALLETTVEGYSCALGSLNRMIPHLKEYASKPFYESILESAQALKQALYNAINYDQTPLPLPVVNKTQDPSQTEPYTKQDTTVPQKQE